MGSIPRGLQTICLPSTQLTSLTCFIGEPPPSFILVREPIHTHSPYRFLRPCLLLRSYRPAVHSIAPALDSAHETVQIVDNFPAPLILNIVNATVDGIRDVTRHLATQANEPWSSEVDKAYSTHLNVNPESTTPTYVPLGAFGTIEDILMTWPSGPMIPLSLSVTACQC